MDSASDVESDVEDLALLQGSQSRQKKKGQEFGEHAYRKDRIFKYLKVQDKNVFIPNLPKNEEHKLTLFIEPDDTLLHTFICDENFGYIANPASKDPEYEFFQAEINQPVLVYMRDHWRQFLDYLKENDDLIEPIIYTSALQPYNKHIMNILDPHQEIFKTILY